MATRRQPLIPGWLIPGISAATLVVAVALAAFLALWWNAPQGDWVAVWQDSYLWHVVRFSFWQAFLSALLSVIPAIFLARALYRRRFPGRLALLRLCAMTLILPVLVAVFGILSVYGRQGWLATLCHVFGVHRSSYRYWKNRPEKPDGRRAVLRSQVLELHGISHGSAGARSITAPHLIWLGHGELPFKVVRDSNMFMTTTFIPVSRLLTADQPQLFHEPASKPASHLVASPGCHCGNASCSGRTVADAM